MWQQSPDPRRGFTLIDLVATFFVAACLVAVFVFAIQQARTRALAVGCRENLRRIGMGLDAYMERHGSLPTVELAGPPFLLANSPQAMIVPALPGLSNVRFETAQPWFQQGAGVGAQTVSVYRCPAANHPDPAASLAADQTHCPLGNLLGTTDYIVCKGPNDAWCMQGSASAVPLRERGAFEIGRRVRMKDITDGLGSTIVVGEGTGGTKWVVAKRTRFPLPAIDPGTGAQIEALNFWSWPALNTLQQQQRTKAVMTSIFGTTAVELNKQPVVETIADTQRLEDCTLSARRGFHSTSGFRSNHIRGSYFLFADGSAHFIADSIEPYIYRALSTISGGESARFVE